MDEELKKLLTLSTKSVTGLTDSLKKESVGESNIKAAVEDQTSSETGLLEDIKNTLQNAFKQQVKTDKEKDQKWTNIYQGEIKSDDTGV